MWAKNFSNNVILSPGFDAYDFTRHDDTVGIEKNIVMETNEPDIAIVFLIALFLS